MADYRKMTVESLRELARKTLGSGHSKRTKAELIALLEGGGKPASRARSKVAERPSKGSTAGKPVPAAKRATPAAAKAARAATTSKAAKPARARAELRPGAGAATQSPAGDDGAPGAEGYFVARVRGEDAVRDAPHPLTETASDAPPDRRGEEPPPALPDEGLGELPWGYGDDTFVALPRDPRTLFLYWDFAGSTTQAAFAGLEGARAELRLYARAGDGWELARAMPFALESRGYYLHDLEPGRIYRAEIHAVGRDGTGRPVGGGSNEMMLPPLGPSPVIDDRFIRIPWDMPLGRLLGPGHAGGPFSDEARALLARLSDWSRFGGGGGSIGGIGGMGLGGRGPGSSPAGGSGSGRGV